MAIGLLGGAALAFTLILWGALRFPASLAPGAASALGSSALLLGYAIAAEWARRTAVKGVRKALATGARVGLLLGLLAVINHSVEVFSGLRAPVPAILGVSNWAFMFFGFAAAGAMTYQEVSSAQLSIVASVWSGLVSAITGVLYALVVGHLFMPRMRLVLSGAFAASGMTDVNAFVVRNMFDGAVTHLLVAPILAAVVGAGSVCVCVGLRPLARRTLAIVGSLDVLLCIAGIWSIIFASSLQRSERPPFIMAGLSALCVSLTAASPITMAIRRRSRRSLSPV
jgi:hypothetical protein